MKKQFCTITGVLLSLTLMLTACGKPPVSSSEPQSSSAAQSSSMPQPSSEPQSSSEPASSSGDAPTQQTEAKLLIGHSDQIKEVPYDGKAEPDALIAALAKETGWNLTLARPVTDGPYPNCLSVAFAGDSAIYTAPPENQKDDYHVYDAKDLIYTVLNSTAETLMQNLSVGTVFFTSPDGGNLDFENGGYAFYLANLCPWDEDYVRMTNEPLPEDSIGMVNLDPQSETCFGFKNINECFMRENVQAGSGTLTVTDEDGNIFFKCDLSDAEKVKCTKLDTDTAAQYNWKGGTLATIWVGKPFEAGKHYRVHMDAGAFKAGDLKSKELPDGSWEFTCLDFGLGNSSHPGNTDVKLGETVWQELILGKTVSRAEIHIDGDGSVTASPSELTKDGRFSFVPTAPGDYKVEIDFFLNDGSAYTLALGYHVVK